MRIDIRGLLSNTQILGVVILLISLISVLPSAVQAQNTEEYKRSTVHAMTFTQLQDRFYKAEIKKEISVNIHGMILEQALRMIARETGLRVSYRGDIMVDKMISIQEENITVSDALANMLANTGLDYKISQDGYLMITEKEDLLNEIFEETVTGTVVDAQTGEPLVGVTIIVRGTNIGTTTDMDGMFSLDLPDDAEALIFSYIGYVRQEVPIDDQNQFDIELRTDVAGLDDLVVVGYGEQRRENLTGSVSQVLPRDLEDRPVVNLSESLSGLVPGLQISTSSGEIGAGSSWQIHGPNTIGAGSSGAALVLVDGVETNPDMINPNDIESISVLKDAASTAIYGSRAPYGVVLITTKSGQRSAEPQFTVSHNTQWRTAISDWDMLSNGRQYAEFMNDLNINTLGTVDPGFGFTDAWFEEYDRRMNNPDLPKVEDGSYLINFLGMNGSDASDWYPWMQGFANTDWFEELHRNNAPTQNFDFSVSGGLDKISYYLSVGYQNRDGLRSHIVTENEKRYTMNARFDADITDWLGAGFQSLLTNLERDLPMSSGFLWPSHLHPTIPVKDPNGNYTRRALNELAHGGRSEDIVHRNYTNTLNITLTPLKDHLIIKGNYTWKNFNLNNETMAREYPFFYSSQGRPVVFAWMGQKDQISRYEQSSNYNTLNLTANYINSIGDHNFSLLMGMQTEEDYFIGTYAARGGMVLPEPSFNFAVDQTVDLTDDVSEWSTLGYFGRLNYNFLEKYLLELNIREAASSRFSKDNRWGTFWGISAGWNIQNEDFFSIDESLIGALKLRTSYGVQGNANVDRIYPMSTVQGRMKTYYINGQRIPELPAPGLVNTDLTWEKPHKLVLGTDMSMLQGRLNFTFDWYRQVTKDMVGPAPPKPDVLGAEIPMENNTELTTKGFDMSFSWRDRIGEVGYNIGLNLSRFSGVITEYYNPDGTIFGINRGWVYYEGQQWGEIWGLTTDKIMSSPQDVAEYHQMNFDEITTQYDMVREGSIAYKDINGDGKIDFGEWTLDDHGDWGVIGNTVPDLFYSFTISADWKGFDTRLFLDGQIGGDWDPGIESTGGWGHPSTTHFFASGGFDHMLVTNDNYNNYWREDRKDAYYFAPFDAGWGGDWGEINARSQTRYLQDLTYLRIRNIQLGYNLPRKWIDNLQLSQFRVYASMENLYTFQRLRVGDPATPGMNYPRQRSISMGVNVQF